MNVKQRWWSIVLLSGGLILGAGCNSTPEPPPLVLDAGTDAGADAGVDAGPDAGSEPEQDAGTVACADDGPVGDPGDAGVPDGATLLIPSDEVHTITWPPGGGVPLHFAFVARGCRHYDLTVEPGSLGYSVVLRDAAGTRLDSSDQYSDSTSYPPSPRHWSGLERGAVHTFYLLPLNSQPRVPFQFRLVDRGPDDHGDLLLRATPWTPSEKPFTGYGEHWRERDLLSFETTVDHVYALGCAFPNPSWELRFLNGQEKSLGIAYDPNDRETEGEARIKSLGGTSYASIQANAFLDPSLPYTCVLNDLGQEDHGDTPEAATPVPAGTASVQGKIEVQGDRDVFALSVQPGHHYQVSFALTGQRQGRIQDAAPGGPFGTHPDSAGIPTSTSFKASQETHSVAMTGTPALEAKYVTGDYTLQVEDQGLDDHGDTLDTATPIPDGPQTLSFRIANAIDHDVYTFQAIAGRRYQLDCPWKVSGAKHRPDLVFLDAQGAVQASTLEEQEEVRWRAVFTAPLSTTYALEFRADFFTSPGTVLGDMDCRFEALAP
ncbi:hypothetical protein HPP05_06930 [Corallococcus exiguus]|uniref:hypothetical protein n=1 Tax=Corallococcus exiguus TaxID=83462 RepID=UPI001494E7B3|nr:hypothetical protein [Corallococcus exiguus]NPC69478.1 hypothetical protein [Corallococcus exiguus]